MTNKFTNGPWVIRKSEGSNFKDICLHDSTSGGWRDDEYLSVTVCCENEEKADSNMNLISTAPDMFLMLVKLSEMEENQMHKAEILDIIKKARGEQ